MKRKTKFRAGIRGAGDWPAGWLRRLSPDPHTPPKSQLHRPTASSGSAATYAFDETVTRLKGDIAAKGIRFFDEIDHTKLGASANLPIRRSTLLLFGNPPLGVQFLQANPLAGLDWPVRMLVTEDKDGTVWISWTDFGFIAARYQLKERDPQIAMASEVAASIASSARKQP